VSHRLVQVWPILCEAVARLCTCLSSQKNHCYHRDIVKNISANPSFSCTCSNIQFTITPLLGHKAHGIAPVVTLLCLYRRQGWVADKGNGLRLMSAFIDSGHNRGWWLLAAYPMKGLWDNFKMTANNDYGFSWREWWSG
jgi:hypothetical protein